MYYEKELKEFERQLKKSDFKDEEEEYRSKLVPQQIDETKAALKDTQTRLENGKQKQTNNTCSYTCSYVY